METLLSAIVGFSFVENTKPDSSKSEPFVFIVPETTAVLAVIWPKVGADKNAHNK